MSYRAIPDILALFAAITGCVAILFVSSPASACSVAPPYEVAFLQNNTPDCLEVRDYNADYETPPTLRVTNDCDETAQLEKLECQNCQETATVEPGETVDVDFVGGDMEKEESRQQTYAWMLGDDREGSILTEVTYVGTNPDACGCGGCTETADTTPLADGSIGLFLLGLLGLVSVCRRK